jgi:hypothetical protein
MKIRTSFVSNSSSTSFTCSSCGENVIGRDMGMSEAEMFECENGHTICEYECAKGSWEDGLTEENIAKYIEEELPSSMKNEEEYAVKYASPTYCYRVREEREIKDDLRRDFTYGYRENVPAKYCPVCSFDVISKEDYMSFLLYKLGMKYKDIKNEIRKEFDTYQDLKDKLKEY